MTYPDAKRGSLGNSGCLGTAIFGWRQGRNQNPRLAFFNTPDPFSVRKSCRQSAEVTQTAGLNCLFFVLAVASTARVKELSPSAAV